MSRSPRLQPSLAAALLVAAGCSSGPSLPAPADPPPHPATAAVQHDAGPSAVASAPAAAGPAQVDPFLLTKRPSVLLRWASAYENGEMDRNEPRSKLAYDLYTDCELQTAAGYKNAKRDLTAKCERSFKNAGDLKQCRRDVLVMADNSAAEFERRCFVEHVRPDASHDAGAR
jgi:hypothetical protein